MPTPIDEVQELAENQISDMSQRILDTLQEDPNLAWTNNELADRLGTTHQRVSQHTRQLNENGTLDREKVGRTFHYFLPEQEFSATEDASSEAS